MYFFTNDNLSSTEQTVFTVTISDKAGLSGEEELTVQESDGSSGGELDDPKVSENVQFSLKDNSGHSYAAGEKITLRAKNGETDLNATQVGYTEISLFSGTEKIKSAESDALAKGSLTVPENCPAGQYLLFVSATYNSITYSTQFKITVTEKSGA